MGYRKHSFSHLVILRIFLNGNNFAIIHIIHTDTQLYLCLFLKTKKRRPPPPPPPLAMLAHSPLGQTKGEAETEVVG